MIRIQEKIKRRDKVRIEIKLRKKSFEEHIKELVQNDAPAGYVKLVIQKYIENPQTYKSMAGTIRYNISDEWIIADILDKYDDDILCSSIYYDGEFMKELSVGMSEKTFWGVIKHIKKISPKKKIVIF